MMFPSTAASQVQSKIDDFFGRSRSSVLQKTSHLNPSPLILDFVGKTISIPSAQTFTPSDTVTNLGAFFARKTPAARAAG